MKLGVKELIELCIYCWGHPLLYTCSGSVAVWMLLSGNLQQRNASNAKAMATSRRSAARQKPAGTVPESTIQKTV